MRFGQIILFFMVFVSQSFALEVDEKLTLRIVNTSETKKTILINRGVEDGLAKGNHAKFFVASGVIARAVCIKLSPTRSVWSVYRLVNADFLRDDQVMKLKITPPVKITKDESRMLVRDDVVDVTKDPRDIGIPLAEGADDLDLLKAKDEKTQYVLDDSAISLLERNKEIFGMGHFSSYTEKSSPDDNSEDTTNDITNLYLQLGMEWFFKTETTWYSRISFHGSYILDRRSTMGHLGGYIREDSNLFGGGINLYPTTRPSRIHRFIQYLNYTFSLGSVTSEYGAGDTSDSLSGSILANTFGYGVKYYTSQGIGMRMAISYTLRGDTYGEDSVGTSYIKTKLGPRVMVGLGYRF